MKSADILNTLLEALDYPKTRKDIINDLDKLLSGETYEKFMTTRLTPDQLPDMIVGATPMLESIYILSDKVLSELTPNLRSRILDYLDRCRECYEAAVSTLKDKVRNTVSQPKKLEEMSREELLEYIQTQLKD